LRREPDIAAMSTASPRQRTCPICGKPTAEKTRPFCSPRCRDVDLHRWLSGRYAVPAVEEDDVEAEEIEGAPPTAPGKP
jgi:endogenous inhibitor of DNA gyrase (YacG/DUF329 family)